MVRHIVNKIDGFFMPEFEPVVHHHILYRMATLDDLPTLVDIYNQSIQTKQSTAILQPLTLAERQVWFDEHCQNSNRPIIVAVCQDSQKVLAYGSFSDLYPMFAYHISSEISIYVHENAKGKGIGKTMLQVLLLLAPLCEIRQIVAKIFAHNTPSLQLFKKFGFEQWGYLPEVCDMNGFLADVVILGKTVTQ